MEDQCYGEFVRYNCYCQTLVQTLLLIKADPSSMSEGGGIALTILMVEFLCRCSGKAGGARRHQRQRVSQQIPEAQKLQVCRMQIRIQSGKTANQWALLGERQNDYSTHSATTWEKGERQERAALATVLYHR